MNRKTRTAPLLSYAYNMPWIIFVRHVPRDVKISDLFNLLKFFQLISLPDNIDLYGLTLWTSLA